MDSVWSKNEECDLTVAQEDTAKVRIAITVSVGLVCW